MKYRLYYGHDCNSVDGFNNGHYLSLDSDILTEEEGYDRCKQFLISMHGDSADIEEIEGGFEVITGYYDADGNSITSDAFLEDSDDNFSYSYEYVTLHLEVE